MSLVEHAKKEFEYAGWLEDGQYQDEMQEEMCNNILEVLEVISKQGHSGFSIGYLMGVVNDLVSYKSLFPLTGDDSEWIEVGEGLFQNVRMSTIFKDSTGQAFNIDGKIFWNWVSYPDMYDGKPFKSSYTSSDSKVNVTFPYSYQTPEHVFVPTEQFPNEIFKLKGDIE